MEHGGELAEKRSRHRERSPASTDSATLGECPELCSPRISDRCGFQPADSASTAKMRNAPGARIWPCEETAVEARGADGLHGWTLSNGGDKPSMAETSPQPSGLSAAPDSPPTSYREHFLSDRTQKSIEQLPELET